MASWGEGTPNFGVRWKFSDRESRRSSCCLQEKKKKSKNQKLFLILSSSLLSVDQEFLLWPSKYKNPFPHSSSISLTGAICLIWISLWNKSKDDSSASGLGVKWQSAHRLVRAPSPTTTESKGKKEFISCFSHLSLFGPPLQAWMNEIYIHKHLKSQVTNLTRRKNLFI